MRLRRLNRVTQRTWPCKSKTLTAGEEGAAAVHASLGVDHPRHVLPVLLHSEGNLAAATPEQSSFRVAC